MPIVVSVWTRWGNDVLGVRDVRPGQALSVGSPRRRFVRFRCGVARLYDSWSGDGECERVLSAGETVRIERDGIEYWVTCSEGEEAAMFRAPRRWLAPVGGVAAASALAVVLALLFLPRSQVVERAPALAPELNRSQERAGFSESVPIRVDVFAATAEPQPQPLKRPGDTRCGRAEMGALVADTRGRYGLLGPSNNADPHLARPMEGVGYPTATALTTEGELGIARTLPGTSGPTAPFGRDTALGTNAVNAVGIMWGEVFAPALGERGLGLAASSGGVVKHIDVAPVAEAAAAPLRMLHAGLRVSGTRKPSEIGRVMAAHFDDFRRCAEDATMTEERRVDLDFDVTAAGQALAPPADSSALEECLDQSVARVAFAPRAGDVAHVVYPLYFLPSTAELRMPPAELHQRPPHCDCGG